MSADTAGTGKAAAGALALAWLVHAYTAGGAVLALLAVGATFAGDLRTAFLWMFLATVVDGTDGWLARRAGVRDVLPRVDGARLDELVDYLTYVFVPAALVTQAGIVSPALALPVAAAMLLSSAYGFVQAGAKTADHFFTGFPSYWNIIVFYLYAGGVPPAAGAVVLLGLCVMVFVPIRYVYPSRTPVLRGVTLGAGGLWAVAMGYLVWTLPAPPGWLLAATLAYPAYYAALSLVLHWRRGRDGSR